MFKTLARVLGAILLTASALLLILLLKPVPTTVPAIVADPGIRYWTLPGGYRIAYRHIPRVAGSTARAPVIFLHGGPGGYVHSSVIKTLTPLSQAGHELYFYDQSGTGRSDRRAKPKDTTIASHLADLEQIRQRIGAAKVILIGQSFGGILASQYAALHPTRIERLVLTSPGVIQPESFDADGRPTVERLYPAPAELRFTPPEGYAEATSITQMPVRAIAAFTLGQLFNTKLIPDTELDAAINTMASSFTKTMVCDPAHVQPEEGGAGSYSRVGTNFYPDDYQDPRLAMRRMTAPVLVLHGQCDFIDYAYAYEYAATFPNARYHFVRGAGHILWWDQPEHYLATITSFLAQSQ